MSVRLLAVLCLLTTGCVSPEPPRGLLGAYRLDGGDTVSISRSDEGTLRYRIYETGKSGRLYPVSNQTYVSGPGFTQQEPVDVIVEFQTSENGATPSLEWVGHDGTRRRANRIGSERTFKFDSDGTKLFARLQLPDRTPPYPAVVLVHGSGEWPGTEWHYNGDFFVANGIAALTYDKRGSGHSDGEFTFDFHRLARDAVAAVNSLMNEPDIDADRIGLSGYSQGGWVAPLASSMSDTIRFVIVNYGMIESPAEEARLEMRQLLVDAGVTDPDLADAEQLIQAAVNVVANELESGWPEFNALKKRYGNSPWMKHLHGTPVDQLVSYPAFLVKMLAKSRLPRGQPWQYNSTKLLESSDTPMVWLLAARDSSSPNEQTVAKLRALNKSGKQIELILFSDADHGMLTFEEVDGERDYTGYVPEYFRAEVDAAWRLIRAAPANQRR